ncbi:hypothetical protein D3C84_1123490 [compost metagenome]
MDSDGKQLPLSFCHSLIPTGSVADDPVDHLCDLPSQQRRHGVTHLMELLGAIPLEEVVVREGLQARSLSYRQASTLVGIVMNEVMTIL